MNKQISELPAKKNWTWLENFGPGGILAAAALLRQTSSDTESDPIGFDKLFLAPKSASSHPKSVNFFFKCTQHLQPSQLLVV